jgi:hypothetical protein
VLREDEEGERRKPGKRYALVEEVQSLCVKSGQQRKLEGRASVGRLSNETRVQQGRRAGQHTEISAETWDYWLTHPCATASPAGARATDGCHAQAMFDGK